VFGPSADRRRDRRSSCPSASVSQPALSSSAPCLRFPAPRAPA
jgi:hypothetical protein